VRKLFGSWNVNLRIICKLPIETHKYIVESISECSHAEKKIFSNYITFVKSLDQSKKPAIKSLLRTARKDIRSTTSSNLRSIFVQTGVYVKPGLTTKHSLSAYKAYEVPQGEEWRISLLSSLMQIREGH